VLGFHGTSKDHAASILANGFRISANQYDWLGDGVYFFQDAPQRAWEWARKFHGNEAAVVGVRLRLIDCMDLLDIQWFSVLSEAYDGFLTQMKGAGLSLPRQTSGAHRLDREVINYAIAILGKEGHIIRAVRAAFGEGAPAFPNSALLERSHVQIAIRDMSVIADIWAESESTS
jgi:hypothetical protein